MSGHIPWRKVSLWLQSHRSLWLCTTRPDGRPHGAPIWFYWDEESKSIFFITARSTVKGQNLAYQPQVSLLVGDGDDTIIINGEAAEVTEEETKKRIDQLYGEKYVDPFSGAVASVMSPNNHLFRVPVKHLMVWEYGSIATRTDWHFNPE